MNILVIEKNQALLENTAEMLELLDHQVYKAENGITGCQMAQELLPDLIICDTVKNESEGRFFLHWMAGAAEWRPCPILLFTSATDEYATDSSSRHPIYCLKKPFTAEEFYYALDTATNCDNATDI